MTWSLGIHHLDVNKPGDSTIIVAEFDDGDPQHFIRRTVLIDGGDDNASTIVYDRLDDLGIDVVDVVIVTHFDKDHFYGIHDLLRYDADGTGMFGNTVFYDQGRQPSWLYGDETGDNPGKRTKKEHPYVWYRNHVQNRHATRRVNSFGIATFDKRTGAAILPGPTTVSGVTYLSPTHVLGMDVMWGTYSSAAGWALAPAPAYAPNRPSLVCIAANKWVRQNAAADGFCSQTAASWNEKVPDQWRYESEKPNPKCLGFLLTFNNFRYYTAGDVEWPQESGNVNRNAGTDAVIPGMGAYLNPTDTRSGRIHAMKLSHHGSDTASRTEFIRRLRPSAAVVSVGSRNTHGHPDLWRINELDGYNGHPQATLTSSNPFRKSSHRPAPPYPGRMPVDQWLTGYQEPDLLRSRGGEYSRTAGDPHARPIVRGHVTILVSENQSFRLPEGLPYRAARAAAQRTADAFPGGALTDKVLDDYADVASSYSPYHLVAATVDLDFDIVDSVLSTAQIASSRDGTTPGLVEHIAHNAHLDREALMSDLTDVFAKEIRDIGAAVVDGIVAAVVEPPENLPDTVAAAILATAPSRKDEADAARDAVDVMMSVAASATIPAAAGYAVLATCAAIARKAPLAEAVALGAAIAATSVDLLAVDIAEVVATAVHRWFDAKTGAVTGAAFAAAAAPLAVADTTTRALEAVGVATEEATVAGGWASTTAAFAPDLGDNFLFEVEWNDTNGFQTTGCWR